MRQLRNTLLGAIASGSITCGAHASEIQIPARVPDRFRVAHSAVAQLEAAAAGIDGATYQAVIAPTFNGSDGNTSFLRLSNTGGSATVMRVTVVGSPSGVVYGEGTLQVPTSASPQYSLQQVLTAASAGPLINGDISYSLYLKDSDPKLSYQHVIYNGANGFFENVGICRYSNTSDYSDSSSKLFNVHTSQLGGYPAQISVHNYGTVAATYSAGVYDAATGVLIGSVQVPVGANATYFVPFTWFEQQLSWKPTSSQPHANIVFTATGGAPNTAIVGQYIFNQKLAAYVNMTQRCGM